MNIKLNLLTVTIIIIALLGTAFILGKVSAHRQIESLSNAVSEAQGQLSDSITSYTKTIKGKDLIISTQSTIILKKSDAVEAGLIEQERLKALNIKHVRENIVLKGRLQAYKDSLITIEPDTITVHDTIIGDRPYLGLPHRMTFEDEWLYLDVNIRADASWGFGLTSDIPTTLTLGTKKVGLFKNEPTAFLTTENPYYSTIFIQDIKIEEKPFYSQPWFKWTTYGAAFVGGFILGGH